MEITNLHPTPCKSTFLPLMSWILNEWLFDLLFPTFTLAPKISGVEYAIKLTSGYDAGKSVIRISSLLLTEIDERTYNTSYLLRLAMLTALVVRAVSV